MSQIVAPLPQDFVPGPYTVVCGRGRRAAEALGNRRLTVMAQTFIPQYSQAKRKEEKSKVVTKIVNMVRQANQCPEHAFVREAEGQWWKVEPLNAREKVGTVLRDLLAPKYRSSTKSKLARRKERRQQKKQEDIMTSNTTSAAVLDAAPGAVAPLSASCFNSSSMILPMEAPSSMSLLLPTKFFQLDLVFHQLQQHTLMDDDLDVNTVSEDDGGSVISGEELEMDNLFA